MAKNEAKIKFTAETGDFNDAIKQSNKEMSELRAELKLNEAQMKTTGASVEGLEDKHRILSSQLQASQDKTEALNQKVNKAIEIYGENSEEVSKLKVQLLNAQTAEEKIKQAIQACNDELKAQARATEDAEEAHESLTDKIRRQQSELNGLKGEYVELVASGKGATDEAKALERSIESLSGELKDNKKAMSNASDMANQLDQSFENAEEGAGSAGDGFTILGGTIASLASSAIQGAIGALNDFVGYLSDLPSATMELRQDLGTLTTSFDNVGMSSETAKDTWKELYAVFGEDDRAVEASNHIARMAKSQQNLNDWVTITTGVWATYQDSLPVEGLAEASAETAKTGTVTGGLADALNWSSEALVMFSDYLSEDVVTAEDAFNVALSECATEQERQALITDTLTKLYGESAETYRETTSAQMEAKEATADQILAEANLATAIEPVTTKFNELKTELMTGVQPAVEKVSGVMVDALDWMEEHPVAMKAIATTVGVLAVALGILSGVVLAYTVAQWAMNAAVLANPITWVIVGIVAVIAVLAGAIVYLWNDCEAFRNFFINLWEQIKTVWDMAQPYFAVLWEAVKQYFTVFITNVVASFQIAWELIKLAWSVAVDWFNVIWTAIKGAVSVLTAFVSGAFKTAWSVIKLAWSVVTGFFKNIWNTIKGIFSVVKSVLSGDFQGAWDAIKGIVGGWTSYFSDIWNKIKNVFANVKSWFSSTFSSAWTAVKNVFSSVGSFFESVLSKIKSTFSKVTDIIKKPFQTAIDAIKSLFAKTKLSFPDIKLPHFKISPSGWEIGDLLKGSIPKLSIDWYADGGIFTKPTIFNTPYGLKGVGEAGAEAVLPIDRLEGYIAGAIEKTMQVADVQALANAVERLANRPVVLNVNGKQFATATANDADNVNGLRTSFKSRGIVL